MSDKAASNSNALAEAKALVEALEAYDSSPA